MNKYIITCDEWKVLEEAPVLLCDQFARFLKREVIYFAPLLFAEYSCLTQIVYEEIDLVVANQERLKDARLAQDDFIAFWEWMDKLEVKINHLSGGWRKLLGVSLFANRTSDSLLFIDFASHFSDRTIAFALERMEKLGICNVGFAEYDQEIIKKSLSSFYQIHQLGARLVEGG